eukprot:3307720-Pyramimonas_sp.AAC.1
MDLFSRLKDATEVEKGAMSAIKDPDLIPSMLSNVKMSMPVNPTLSLGRKRTREFTSYTPKRIDG